MKINIHHIHNDDEIFNFQERADRFGYLSDMGGAGDPVFNAPLSVRFRVFKAKDIVRVTGQLQTIVEMACSRCLKRFDHPFECALDMTFVQQQSDRPEDALPQDYQLDAHQAGLIYFQGDEIDLRNFIAEQIIMALPYNPLCLDDCRGLCSRCGADLNTAACRCNDAPPDGPFAVLQQLKKKS